MSHPSPLPGLPRSTPHTPGPWAWDEHQWHLRPAQPDPRRHAVHTILDLRHGGCGFLGSSPAQTAAELDADYRLIESAPLLLAALQALRGACSIALADSAVLTLADEALAAALGLPAPQGEVSQ